MAKYSNTVEYNIKTSLDSKGLTQLKSELQGLELKLQNMGNKGLLDEKTFVDARNQIQGLGQALTDAFNPSLGMLDLSKLNQELKNNDVTAQGLKTAFSSLGAEGQVAFNNLVGELGKLDTGILRTNSQIDKLFTTFSNTFRWGLVSSFFSNFMNSIHQSVNYVKELDDSLTQIMLVTDYNRDAMNQYAKSANEAAKAVSMTTTGMTNASLIFAQQGYDLGQSQELATLSAKLANASQQDTATTSDQITAYMNAYGLQNNMEELAQQMDNWALIANVSAADVGELAQASQRAASMANAVGVSGEQLAAQIATIESVTREAPEQIGNGLKTLYARFSDIASGKEDEEGFSLGKVTSELNKIGVQVLNEMGQIRDVGDIMEDLMVIWDDLDQTSKVAASQALAGKYQVNRFMALMDNSSMYEEYKGATGNVATGTLDQMNEEFANSIEGRTAKLQASLEGLFSTIFNTDDIYPWMDAAQGAIDLLQQFFEALGGGKTVLLGISSLLMQIFSKNMAQEINNAATNRAVQQQKLANLQNSEAALTTLGLANPNSNDANSQGIINFAKYMNNEALKGNFNADQMNQANTILEEMIQNSNAATTAANELKETLSVIGTAVTATTGESILAPFLDSEGAVNATLLSETLQKMSQSEVTELFGNIQQDIQPAREGLLEFNKALQAYQQELRNTASNETTWTEKVQILEDALYNLQGKIDPDTYQRYIEAVTDIVSVTDDAGDKTAETTAKVAKLAEGLEKVAGKDLTNLDQLNNAAFKAKNTQSAAADSQKVAGAFQEGIDSQKQIQGILNTLNAVQQLTFAWQAFQNLGSLWTNEDLSIGEKIFQTIMNLTMAMPQLITAMDTLKTSDSLKNIGQNLLSSLDFSKNGQKSLLAKKQFDELVVAATKGREAMDAVKFAGRNMSDEIREGLEKTITEGTLAEDTLTKIGPELLETSIVGTTGLEAIKASLAGLATSAKAFLVEFWPLLLIGAAVAGISALIGAAQEQAEQAHQEAVTALEEAKNAQQQAKDLSSQIDDWQSKRKDQGNSKELAQEADALADSLRELGNEEEAEVLHLAAIKAEVLGTSESFEKLDQAMEKAQFDSQNSTDLATMEAANAILKDRLSTVEELDAANKDLQNTALDYNLRQASKTNGWEMGILNSPGDDDIRAATMDWQSLNSILEKSVPGFAEIADENERLSLALAHTSDEAQRAAIQIQQMLNTSNTLSDDQKTGITRQLESAGFSAQEALQVIASLNIDEETSYNNIVPEIQDIIHRVNEDKESLSVVLQAKMDPEQVKETVKSQIATYEPKDEDVDKEDFDSLADTFYENKNQMGVEGTPFEDFSEGLFENAAGLEDVIEGILRYNDAIESLDKNYDNWKDTLENTNELSTEHLQVVGELQETYSDFLGLSRNVSKRFASNAENLELMQEAAEGNTEAFEDLEDAAAADIYMQVTGLEDLDAAQQKIEEINDILANSGIEEIPVGEIFNLDDFESVRSAIDSELQALGLNAEQAAQYVSDVWHLDIPADQFTVIDDDMNAAAASAESTATHVAGVVEGVTDTVLDNANYSVSTDIDKDTAEATDTVTFTNLTPQPIGPVPITSMMPVGNGNTGVGGGVHMEPFVAETYGVGYTPETHTTEQLKQQTGFKEDVKAEKGGNGHVSLPSGSGAQGSRRPSSGSGRSGVSRPSSGRGGGGSCFVAGTPISMLGYYKNIEEIQPGDIVLSYNEQTKKPEFSQVAQTMIHDVVEPIYTLHIKNEQLRVTGIHRFLITDNIIIPNPQWICAEDLHIGDWVLFADSTWHVIHKIEVNIEHQIVYNFEVSGNHNYYVGRNQILAHNKGGGGGSGKTYNAKTKEPVKKEKDLYERVNTQLDDIETTLKGIEKEEDRLIGDKARANMNKQIQLLDREIDLQKEKLDIQKKERADLAKELVDYGYRFDSNGFIGNYNQVITNYEKRINDLINQYNRTTTEDGQEKLAKQIETLEKEYDKAKKAADRYDQLQGKEIQDTLNTIQDLQDAIEDLRIDAWKASTEAIDNLKELRENAADLEGFFSDYESDSPFRDLIVDSEKLNNIWSIGKKEAQAYYNEIIADKEKALKASTNKDERAAIKTSIDYFKALRDNLSDTGLNNGLLGLAYQDMLQLKEWYENPKAKDNVFGENTAALKEAYEEAYNRVHDMTLEYEKEVENYRDSIIDAYDEIEDKQTRQIDKFDRVIDRLEHFSDMYSLYYGDESYDMLRDTLQQQGNTLREQLRQQQNLYQYWSERYAEAVAIGDEKLMNELEDKMNDAEDKMADLAEDAAKAFVDSYENAVKASTQHIIQNTIGDRNFDRLDRNWEWDKDYLEKYHDNVERAYEMDKLRNKYTDLLNQAQGASLQTQNKIRAQMQEQLALLDGQKNVSEYDVKLANAKLEILQKQIALEDAQRNKNQMKLRRDTQGNYRYVYTANQDDVSGAQQDLFDSEYDAYELSKNQQINNYDDLINAYQRYLSQREEILTNANLSEAEKMQQNAELYDKFLKFVDGAREDIGDAAYGTLDILQWLTLNGTEYTTNAAIDMLNELLDEQGNIKDATGIIWMDNATYLTDEVIPKISEAVEAADNDIKDRLNELKQNVVGKDGVIPYIVNGIKGEDGLTTALDEAKISTDGLVVATRDLMEALNGDNSALAEAQAQLQNYLEELNNVKNASSVTAQQLRDTQKQLDKSQAESLNYKTQLDDLKSGKTVIENGKIVDPNAKKKTTTKTTSTKKKNGDWTGFTGSYHSDSWGSGPSGDWYSGEKNAVRISSFSRQSGYGPYNVHLETGSGGWLGWVKESQLFDTGGYTGKWTGGDKRENGKLAFLHQKELILNAEDTKNILAAVNIVREIGTSLRNNIATATNSITKQSFNSVGDTIEQRVEINATFPNATDADDIRQALIGLSDKAYQYAHRTI